jgi:hypothetical protein
MNMKLFKLTLVFIYFCICGLCLLSMTDARAEQSNIQKEPLFSEMPKYLKEDLLLYYSFDKPFSTKLTDLSGNNTHGEVNGVEYRPEGRYGGAGFFDGTDKFISVENVHMEAFTFSAWIKTSTGGINNRRVFLFDSGEESFFAIQGATSGDVEFNTVIWQEDENEWEDDGIQTEDVKLQENTWTHIAVSFDGSKMGIYFNGRLIQMKDLARDGFTGTFYIGGIEAHRGEFWHGMIDEAALFKRALFAAEIEYLYNPTRDNPLVELKSYCEREEGRSPKLLDILLRVASEMQKKDENDPNLPCGRGVAHFYEIEKKSEEKDKWEQEEEDRIIQFQFKGNSSRSDVFSGLKGKVKQLEWIFAENSEYGIRYDGDDLSIEDNHIGIFHRELGYDMHPDTFNSIYGIELSEFLFRVIEWAKNKGLHPSTTLSDDGILQLAFVHTTTDKKVTLQERIDMGPPARVLSIIETEENNDEQRTKENRQYRVSWQWHSDQCYIKDVENIVEETELDTDTNPKQPCQRYMHQKLEVLGYESNAAILDHEFTLWGLPLKSDTDILDNINKSEYNLDDVLSGRIKPGPRYKSLIGTKLPSLKPLVDDTITPLISEKVVLICFFDMNQRSSRHCVTQLAGQAEQLKSKGVAVVAVQASRMEREDLNQWVKKYNIPFPIGMIQDDSEKARFNWGVKSLPWLILTDNKHIVRGEGFALNELDVNLQQIRGD